MSDARLAFDQPVRPAFAQWHADSGRLEDVAGPQPSPKRRKRRSAAPSPAPAPSRIRNERQQRIVETVEGFESVISTGAALSAVHGVWLLTGLATLGIGLGVLTAGPDSDLTASLLRTYRSLGYGVGLLTLLTTVLALVWAVQASLNVPRLARAMQFGQFGIFARHLPALVVGGILIGLAPGFEEFERLLRLGGGVLVMWGVLLPAGLGHGALQMLWRTSWAGKTASKSTNRDVTVWFVGVVAFCYASTAAEYLGDLTLAAQGFLAVVAGLGMVGAALAALRLVPAIAVRQEERLGLILGSFGDDEPGDHQPVTAQQIDDAWKASSDLFTVDGRH